MLLAADLPPESIVENYTAASLRQDRMKRGSSMEMDIEASLPKLQKQGRLHALRRISSLGRITFEALHFEGDNTVKKNVIAHYLAAETEVHEGNGPSLAVTPANYKFKYKGIRNEAAGDVYVFHVTPRHKQVGLFKGEIWVDAATCLRVHESGRFVKNPSIFIKSIEFVREFDIRDGAAVPRQIHSTVETRLVGPAEMTVEFRPVTGGGEADQATLVENPE